MGSTRAHGFLLRAWCHRCFWILILGVPLSAAAPSQLTPYKADGQCQNSKTEYYYEDLGICCSRCPPGQFMAERCTAGADTVCSQCPSGRYTELWNYISYCHRCAQCDSELGFEVDTPCSATQETLCRCMPGTHCKDRKNCIHCTQNTKCRPGEEVTKPGTVTSDTQCSPCPAGSYQDKTSLDAQCQQHTNCLAQGRRVITPGTLTSDSICSEIPPIVPRSTVLRPAVPRPTAPRPTVPRSTAKSSTAQSSTSQSSTVQSSTIQTLTIGPEHKHQEWGYMSHFLFILLALAILSIIVILTFLLVRGPSLCKELGLFFRRKHQETESHHRGNLDSSTLTEPFLNPPQQEAPVDGPVTSSEINNPAPHPNVESENLQQEAVALANFGSGPHRQETMPPSSPDGCCPTVAHGSGPQKIQPALHQERLIHEQTQETIQQAAGAVPQNPAVDRSAIQMVATNLTHNGDIYIIQHPMEVPQVTTKVGTRPTQATPDPCDPPTTMPEQGPPLFSRGSPWQCVSPQQEEGKDIHLTTEESLMENVCPWSVDRDRQLYAGSARALSSLSSQTPLAEQVY